jgi:predicted CXXCH cytochrome family protein
MIVPCIASSCHSDLFARHSSFWGSFVKPLIHRIRPYKTMVSHGDRKLAVYVGILVALLALLPRHAAAAVHPVPLDKNTDAAKCLECHEDKAKGKFVHSAIATGCLSCHEVRVSKDATHIKLITATPAALCITCHADKKAADIHCCPK